MSLSTALIAQAEQSSQDTSKKQIQLLHADKLSYDQSISRAQKLNGSVQFKYKETLMFCDSAFMFRDSNIIKALSNVRIKNDEGVSITGDSLVYFGKKKKARITGNVLLKEKDKTLKAPFVEYNFDTKMAYYAAGGTLYDRSENSTLESEIGYYYTQSKQFFFKDSVFYKHPDYVIHSDTMMHQTATDISYFKGPTHIQYKAKTNIYCQYGWFNQQNEDCKLIGDAVIEKNGQEIKADSIVYNDKNAQGEAFYNVQIDDTTEKIMIQSHFARFNTNDSTYLATDSALMIEYSQEDSLFLHADTLYSFSDSTEGKTLFAYHGVRFYKKDLQGICDSLVMKSKDSLMYLYTNPVLWSDSNQMTADTILLWYSTGKIDSMRFLENAFILETLDSVKYNQISGRYMQGFFTKDNKLKNMRIQQRAKTIYYPKNKEDYIGINQASSTEMNIRFKKQEINQIIFYNPESSSLSPLSPLDFKKLPGFQDRSKYRPISRSSVFLNISIEPESQLNTEQKQKG